MPLKVLVRSLLFGLAIAACSTASPTPTLTPEPTPPPSPTVAPTATEPKVEASFEASECPFDVPAGAPVECGFVVVPEDHGLPAGPKIRLAVVIIRDQSERHQPDPVLLLAGGPGERVVANTLSVAPSLSPLHPSRDLILFDQRGVGESEPALECPEFAEAMMDILDEADADAATRTVFDAFASCRDRMVGEGINLAAYTTAQNAADVEAIRIALGYDQVNLYGGSYGSLLAQAVMRDFPEHLRSVAFNSTLPLEKSLFVDAYSTTANAILRMLDACAAEAACNQAYPDLRTVLFEVIDRLNAEPVPITLVNPNDGQSYPALLTGDAVRANLVTFLYITDAIPVLPQAIYDVYNDDFDLMTQLSSSRLALLDLLSRGMMASVMCQSDFVGKTQDDLLEAISELPPQLTGSGDPQTAIEYGMYGICEQWPVPEADAAVKQPVTGAIPTLILEGEFDPVTPPEYGQLVASHLSRGYYFELAGVGHDVLGNDCAKQIAGAFVIDPATAPAATCLAELPGATFELPGEQMPELVLEPFTDEQRGFTGLVPAGWQELAPANLARAANALDPTYFVLEAAPTTASEMLTILATQLGFDPGLQPSATDQVGSFAWSFYEFERQGYPANLALAEQGGRTYFVLMISTLEEHEALYAQLFMPAVERMAPLD